MAKICKDCLEVQYTLDLQALQVLCPWADRDTHCTRKSTKAATQHNHGRQVPPPPLTMTHTQMCSAEARENMTPTRNL
jgi:hypothetical protein